MFCFVAKHETYIAVVSLLALVYVRATDNEFFKFECPLAPQHWQNTLQVKQEEWHQCEQA